MDFLRDLCILFLAFVVAFILCLGGAFLFRWLFGHDAFALVGFLLGYALTVVTVGRLLVRYL